MKFKIGDPVIVFYIPELTPKLLVLNNVYGTIRTYNEDDNRLYRVEFDKPIRSSDGITYIFSCLYPEHQLSLNITKIRNDKLKNLLTDE
jgi:hypothetical protein